MRLIDNCSRHPERCPIEMAEKAFEAVGLSQRNAQEFTTDNMADFNLACEDSSSVEYYSVGAHKAQL